MLIPLAYYARSQTGEITQAHEARVALEKIKLTGDSVHSMGYPARRTVTVYVPRGIIPEQSGISDNTLSYKLTSEVGEKDVFVRLNTCIKGALPIRSSYAILTISALEDGCILLEQVKIIVLPTDMYVETIINNNTYGYVNITNVWVQSVDLTLTALGDIVPYVDVDASTSGQQSSVSISSINIDETRSVNILFFATNISDNSGTFLVQGTEVENHTVNVLFKVVPIPDNIPPVVTNTSVNATMIDIDEYLCVTAIATDNLGVEGVWAMFTSPSRFESNVTLYDDGSTCDGVANDSTYSKAIKLSESGTHFINTSFADDMAGNLGYESPHPDLIVRVMAEGGPGPQRKEIDEGWYFKTDNACGLECADDEMNSYENITEDLRDDNILTPPGAYVIKVDNSLLIYEGYITQLDRDTSEYLIIKLRFLVDDLPNINYYHIKIYPYNEDGKTINTLDYTDFNVTVDSQQELPKWFEIDVSDSAFAMDGFGWIRFRITADPSMSAKSMHIAEMEYKVG